MKTNQLGVGDGLGLGVVIAALGLAAVGCSGVDGMTEEGAPQEKIATTGEALYNGFLGDFNPGTPSAVLNGNFQSALAAHQGTKVVSKFDRSANVVNWSQGSQGIALYNTNDRPLIYVKSGTTTSLQSHGTAVPASIHEANSGTTVDAASSEWPNRSPFPYLRHDGFNCTYWVGDNGWITESYWDTASSSWISNNMHTLGYQTVPATTSPMAYRRTGGNGPSSTVLFGCGQADFCELVLTSSGWHFYQTQGRFHNFKAGTRPVGFAPTAFGWYVVANTTSGIEILTGSPDLNNGSYPAFAVNLDSSSNYQGSPMGYRRSDGLDSILLNYASGGVSRIREFNKSGAAWSGAVTIYTYSGNAHLSEPFPFVTKEGINSLLVQDAGFRLMDIRETFTGSNTYAAPKFLTW
jgi:hypothetical protein